MAQNSSLLVKKIFPGAGIKSRKIIKTEVYRKKLIYDNKQNRDRD